MIIDIQFRWVERRVHEHAVENVLQWRKLILDPSKSANPTWTEWQDVRTEEDTP